MITFIKKLNIADYFSLYRILAVPFIVLCIVYDKRLLTSLLLVVSFMTDALDGFIARKKNMVSARGAKLDSVGDLFTLVVGIAAFVVFETSYFLGHLPIIVVTFLLFLFQVVVALVRFGRITSYHTYLAKIAAFCMAVFLSMTPVTGPVPVAFYVAFSMVIAEVAEEILITFILREPKDDVRGLYWVLKK